MVGLGGGLRLRDGLPAAPGVCQHRQQAPGRRAGARDRVVGHQERQGRGVRGAQPGAAGWRLPPGRQGHQEALPAGDVRAEAA